MVGVHVPQPASRSERQTFRSLPTFHRFWGLDSGPWVCVANTLPTSCLASHPVDFFKVCFVFNYIFFVSVPLSVWVCVRTCTCMHAFVVCLCVCMEVRERLTEVGLLFHWVDPRDECRSPGPTARSHPTSSPGDFKTHWIAQDQQGMFSFLLIPCYV